MGTTSEILRCTPAMQDTNSSLARLMLLSVRVSVRAARKLMTTTPYSNQSQYHLYVDVSQSYTKEHPKWLVVFFSKHQKPRLHEHQVPNPDSNLDHNPHGRGAWSESGFESSLLPCKRNQSGSGSGSESRLMNVKIIRP